MIFRIAAAALILAAGFTLTAIADEAKEAAAPQTFVSSHSGRFNGVSVRYTASAGETHLKDKDGKPLASIFSIAYVREGVSDPAARPVVFLFNGGPGSASLWLHMGAFGPKRVVLPSDAKDDGAAPYRIEDNPLALLDIADFVFIDPVGTGFSRPLGDHKGEEFWGITEDAKSVAQFIRAWVTKNGRWNSPKYVGGESYGTVRTSAVVNELEGGINDIALNGIILVSTLQSYWDSNNAPGNDFAYIAYVPTMTATAVYHGQIDLAGRPLAEFLDEVRAWALEEYLPALYLGDRLAAERAAAIAGKLAAYTGLSESYVRNAKLRIDPGRFQKELLRNKGLTIGRLDSRYTGVDADNAGEFPDFDPSFYGIDAGYTAAVNDYLRRTLKVAIEGDYEPLSFQVNRAWNAKIEDSDFNYGVAHYVAKATRENSEFRIFNAAGYYDFATPFFESENAFARAGLAPGRITYAYYEAGHMMYVHQPSIEKLMKDVRDFILAGAR
ncbi:MAG TPA: peptidase S10 [Sphingomonadales bacterium]|nr:peptidase S10 [Sphingomonadales bacterium]